MRRIAPEVVALYTSDPNITISQIAKRYTSSGGTIKEILVRNGVTLTWRRKYRPLPEHVKEKLRKANTGRPNRNLGRKHSQRTIINMWFRRMKITMTDEAIAFAASVESMDKLKVLSRSLRRHRDVAVDLHYCLQFLIRHYHDPVFTALYERWVQKEKHPWYRPSLDHKVPLQRGGTHAMDNLHFLTWFENHAKLDYTWEEWQAFKAMTGTSSELFIENYIPRAD